MFPIAIAGYLSSLSATALTFLLPKKSVSTQLQTKTDTKINYNFAPNHVIAQQRINRICGDGFGATFTFKNIDPKVNGKTVYIDGSTETLDEAKVGAYIWLHGMLPSQFPIYSPPLMLAALDSGISQGKVSFSGGWKYVSWLYAKNPDELSQLLYRIATDGNNFSPAINTGDTYKAYTYPSPEITNGTENYKYFIRCAPQELTCMLFGKTIAPKDIVIFLGSIAATIVVGVAAVPLILAAVKNAFNTIKNGVNINLDEQTAPKVASDLANIYNGAAIEVSGGSKQDMVNIATDFVKNNPNLFTEA